MKRFLLAALCAAVALPSALHAEASLKGSRTSMVRQHQVAKNEAYLFLRTPAQVERKLSEGKLVSLPGNDHYELANVSFPYARPEVKLFVERLGAEYRDACGEALVVTSLTRPLARQPRNASKLSVHPAGMAIDLRIPRSQPCRSWLEARLLDLEGEDLLDVTRERRPPHYHVALFPSSYRAHMEEIIAAEQAELDLARQDSIRMAEATRRELEAQKALAQSRAATAGPSVQKSAIALLVGLPLALFAWYRRYMRDQRGMVGARLPRDWKPPAS